MKNPIPTLSRRTAAITVWLVLVVPAAWAHPDHTGSTHFGLSHYVFDPFHAIWLLGVVALAVIAWRMRARTSHAIERRKPTRSA